jgi:hypothetical protein
MFKIRCTQLRCAKSGSWVQCIPNIRCRKHCTQLNCIKISRQVAMKVEAPLFSIKRKQSPNVQQKIPKCCCVRCRYLSSWSCPQNHGDLFIDIVPSNIYTTCHWMIKQDPSYHRSYYYFFLSNLFRQPVFLLKSRTTRKGKEWRYSALFIWFRKQKTNGVLKMIRWA